MTGGIGEQRESALHKALKDLYSRSNDVLEARVGTYVVDILADHEIIEVQTSGFSSIRGKLKVLLASHSVRLVHPIAAMKFLVMLDDRGRVLRRRRSPKRGRIEDLFDELRWICDIVMEPRFHLEIAMVEVEEFRCADGNGSWRRGGVSVKDRKLGRLISREVFDGPDDYLELVPADLDEPFDHEDMAGCLGMPVHKARIMSYCLRRMGALRISGKRGNWLLMERVR
ncbi:hypothetical protein JW905_19740 [bacterium]|nr:hypothetical protein [candidate division CSSED10-310 bacterium]